MKTKLYLLPLSLLLLNPAFSEEPAPQGLFASFLEETPQQKHTDAIEIDPIILQELNSEITAMLEKKEVSFAEESYDDEEMEYEAPKTHVRRYATKPSQAPKKAEVSEDSDYEEPVQQKRLITPKRETAAPKARQRVAESENEQEAPVQERNAPSPKRQVVTPKRQNVAPKAKQKVVESEYEEPVQERRAPAQKRQNVAPKAKQKVVESEYEEPAQERRAPAQKRQNVAPKARQKVVESEYEEPVQERRAPAQKRQNVAPKAKQKVVESEHEEPVQERRAPAQKRQNTPQNRQSPRNVAPRTQRKTVETPARAPQQRQRQAPASRPKANNQVRAEGRKKNAVSQSSNQTPKRRQAAQNDSQMQMDSSQSMKDKSMGMMYNTSAAPTGKHAYDVWIRGDALWWQAVEENLTYVYSSNPNSTQTNYDFHTVDFSWDWGWRVGGGVNTHRDGWDIGVYWTHINNHSHDHETSSANKELLPVWGVEQQLFPGVIDEADAHLRVKLDEVELNLGRNFYVGKHLTTRPYAGVRTDWIHQKHKVEYEGVTTFTGTALEQKAKLKSRFWGIGFVAGLDTDWLLGCGFSIYGKADAALLMGFFDVDQTGTQNGTQIWSLDKSFRTARAILDLGMGLKWARLFCNDRFGLAIRVGYEYHDYFRQNQFLLSNGSDDFELFNPADGDLAYQGGIASLQLDF